MPERHNHVLWWYLDRHRLLHRRLRDHRPDHRMYLTQEEPEEGLREDRHSRKPDFQHRLTDCQVMKNHQFIIISMIDILF